MVFTTKWFLEVALGSGPEWNLNQHPLNSFQTFLPTELSAISSWVILAQRAKFLQLPQFYRFFSVYNSFRPLSSSVTKFISIQISYIYIYITKNYIHNFIYITKYYIYNYYICIISYIYIYIYIYMIGLT